MATLVANGNRSVTSAAYTNDGYFEHALDSSFIKGTLNSSGYKDSKKPKVFGEKTVWKNGVAYPDSYWAQIEVVPVEHPFIKGRWVHPNRVAALKKEYASNVAYNKTRNAVSSGINKATGAASKEMSDISNSSTRALREYQSDKWRYNRETGKREYTGNIVGETAARLRGAVGGSATAKAAKNEAGNIKGGWQSATSAYDAAHRQRTYKRDANGNMVVTGEKNTGNAIGRAAAGAKGAVGASAVGRAGKAAFEALTNKFEDFKSGINKYLTGENAGKNRAEALSKLREKAGGLISAIGSALGTSEGRSKMVEGAASALGTITGTAAGVAKGIASSNIGKAAITAGRSAYGAVKDKVGSALDAIAGFFKKKYKSAPGGRVLEGA